MPKIKILQIVGQMNRGGVETWLMNILRNLDRDKYIMDFLYLSYGKSVFDDEIRSLGSNILKCGPPFSFSSYFKFKRNFKRLVKQYGPYDIIHTHTKFGAGLILKLAHKLKIPNKITHIHTAPVTEKRSLFRKFYIKYMKFLISKYASVGIAVSSVAAKYYWGHDWESYERRRIIYCGIDLASYHKKFEDMKLKRELNIPLDAKVIGHIGNIKHAKNHCLIVDMFAELVKIENNVILILVGNVNDKAIMKEIERKLHINGITNEVKMLGRREDIPDLLNIMDCFIFPSLFEGLPLSLLEAQYSGIPSIISDSITTEVDCVKELVIRMSLTKPPIEWALKTKEILYRNSPITLKQARNKIDNSDFNIKNSLNSILSIYNECISRNS